MRIGAPTPYPHGLNFIGPIIIAAGTEEQKKRFLPGILSGDATWCQGYSEAGAGSDLASLQTRAVLDGDHFVVNGHKMWTTNGHYADWMFALVRTDPEAKPRHAGITMLLIDMHSPGHHRAADPNLEGRRRIRRGILRRCPRAEREYARRPQSGLAHRRHGAGRRAFHHRPSALCAGLSATGARARQAQRRLGRCRFPRSADRSRDRSARFPCLLPPRGEAARRQGLAAVDARR